MENQLSVKQWVITILLLSIPIVNIILLITWAFGEKNYKTNYSRAVLIIGACYIGIVIILAALGVFFASTFGGYSSGDYEEVTYISDYVDEDIEVLEIFLEDSEQEYAKYVSGKIINNSIDRSHTSISLDINFYDENDLIVGTHYINIDGTIPPGEIYLFKEWIPSSDVAGISEAKSTKILGIY